MDTGTRGAATARPSGTVSFVLGDMVGSTRLWEDHATVMPQVLARLDALVVEHADVRAGHRPPEQGEGDNFVVAFARPVDAVEFAADLQAALCAEPWPEGLSAALRIAVHTGAAQDREGGRYMGETLNRCARLRALAHGGQVLVSGATAAPVAEHLTGAVFLRDLGAHQLRDLSQPERVAQLCGPGLPFEFGPLRSLNRALTNLPLQVTSFVGRAGELAETTLLLADRRHVTLAGAGGCGKTRLAVQLGAEVLDDFPDGVWFADLAPLTDPDLVGRTLATAAGVTEVPGQPILDTLADRFTDSVALVVLDNCEHLLDGAAAVAERLLAGCVGVRVLATSREPLGTIGETTYRIPSLGLPAGPDDAGCESVALFVDRAALARPTMRVGPDELAAITTVCSRLDGIPLAIELAAARCRSMTPSQIAERLGDHFELLTGGSRRALPRHRALEASVEWSYNLLSDDERAMLCRLSVFAGGFTLAAAEAVGVDSSVDTWAVVDRLTGLVDKSLVLQSDDGRYGLLETVRQFAETRLAGAGDAEQARRRHAAHFAQVTASAEAGLYGPEHLSTRRALQLEIDNLRSALDWAEAAGQIDLALSLMLPIDLFWQRQLAESTDRLNRLLAAPSAAPAWRLLGFAAAAEMACVRGDAPDLVSRVEQGLSLLDEAADPVVRGWLQELSGWGRFFCGQHGAEENARAGVELLRSCQSPRARYYMLDGLWAVGLSAIGKGRCSEGLAAFAEAATEADLTGAPFGIGRSSVMFGHMQATFGRFGPARQLSSTGRRLLVECDDELRNFGIGGQALADGLTGWDPDAVAWLRTTLEEARRDHHWFALAWGEWALALLETKGYGSGDWRQPVAEAETFMRAVTFGWGAAWAKALAAENLVVEGDPAAARIACEEALAEVEAHTYAEFGRGPVELALARVDRAQGDLVTAEDTAHRALATLTAAGLALQQVEAIELLAALAAQQGSPAEAVRLFAAASTARAELTFPVPPAEVARRAADLEPARRALSAEELTAAESEGRAMSLGEANTYASRGRGPRKRPTTGWHSLTPTEAEVVALVAEGLTNPAIAAKLFVSRETVKSHLSNSLAKLGVSNRTELATLVARRS